MRLTLRLLAGCAAIIALNVVMLADEKKEEVDVEKLPQALIDTMKAKFPRAAPISAVKEKEDGKEVFEVKIKHQGSVLEVTVTPEGKILSIEKEIAEKDLPKAVADSLKAKYADATIKKAEQITKDDKVASYEVVIVAKDKQSLKVCFDPAGKFLEEKKAKEE